MARRLSLTLSLMLAAGCGAEGDVPAPEDDAEHAPSAEGDLPLGDLSAEDAKADGNWGAALTCKPVPALPRLAEPEIFVSLDGLTLRLVDRASGFEKVFPVGVGQIDTKPTSSTFLESLSYFPVLATGRRTFAIKPSTIQPCKTWWTDPANGQRSPVFAGLPFLSFHGNYAIHGPIDNFRAQNGGSLRRGYVSHGCVRMESADVLELYARIKGVPNVPVHVQREPERRADGTRVDVERRWIGAECSSDADCNFTGGFCHANRYSGRGFCTARCTGTCADRPGQPVTMCVADPDAAGQGMCVARETSINAGCRPQDHFVARTQPRFGSSTVRASVCVPGSKGWIGDRCFADGDCQAGNRCAGASGDRAGLCTQACRRACPDQPGFPWTLCVDEADLGGATCVRQCTPSSNASECPADHTCVARTRNGDPRTTRHVCIPD